jgi:hypothetical protein
MKFPPETKKLSFRRIKVTGQYSARQMKKSGSAGECDIKNATVAHCLGRDEVHQA